MEEVISITPIRPPKTNAIRRKGYYSAITTRANQSRSTGRRELQMDFEISKGKCRGFKLSTKFYDSIPSRCRLGHLCDALGIKGDWERMPVNKLVGKPLVIWVVPTYKEKNGNRYLEHEIRKFHHVNWNKHKATKYALNEEQNKNR